MWDGMYPAVVQVVLAGRSLFLTHGVLVGYVSWPQNSLHGGCPVIKGDKWVATKWLRDLPFGSAGI